MSPVKTYEISLPLSERDYNFLKQYVDNPKIEISDEIREAFYLYKPKKPDTDEINIFDKKDYSKFIGKLKEKKFIEQFENGFGHFNIYKFYSKLEKSIKKESILFDENYDVSEEQVKIIDDIVTKILNNYFNDDSPRWLIRAYVCGRVIYSKDKYKPNKPSVKEVPLSSEAKKIAKINNLELELAKRIDVALDYSKTTIECLTNEQLKNLRRIIIDDYIIKNQPIYKLIDKIHTIFPNDDVFLINIAWRSVLSNELNYIANRARLELKPSNSYVICLSFKGCCDNCAQDIVGKVFKISEAPHIPYEKCTAEICLCNLLPFNPKYQFISSDGQIKLKVENEKEWKLWFLKNIMLEDEI
ncbi:MAG: hypothetical protein WC209_09520 [Ignavibacteriaceae bacterium]|jgi:hypothetical protein